MGQPHQGEELSSVPKLEVWKLQIYFWFSKKAFKGLFVSYSAQ